MKKITSLSLILSGILTAALQANDVLIYKITYIYTSTDQSVVDPGGPLQKGSTLSTDKYTFQRYAIIEREPRESGGTVEIISLSSGYDAQNTVDIHGSDSTSKKTFSFSNSPSPLSLYFDSPQPVKGHAVSLWNQQEGDFYTSRNYNNETSGQLTGIATPLVLSTAKTIPDVPRTISGKDVGFTIYSGTAKEEEGETYPAYEGVASSVSSWIWTLDTTLTKAANATPVAATADLATVTGEGTYSGHLPAGTLENGVQRVHDLIYKSGYRLEAPYDEEGIE